MLKTIRLLLVDDHRLLRRAVQTMLLREADIEVIGEAGTGEEALELAGRSCPDVVLLDLRMPGLSGLETAQALLREHPAVRIIVYSCSDDPVTVHVMMGVGVQGFVPKSALFHELVTAIREVASGAVYRSPGLTSKAFQWHLTPCEIEVLKLLANGETTKSAALLLYRSPKTIESHRRSLMEKLECDNVHALTKLAIRLGLTTAALSGTKSLNESQ